MTETIGNSYNNVIKNGIKRIKRKFERNKDNIERVIRIV